MKILRLLTILLLGGFPLMLNAQDPTKYASVSDSSFRVYFNSEWENIDNPNNATYFRKSYRISADSVVIKDYYRSGQVQMEGHADKFIDPLFNGTVVWYYADGNIQNTRRYEEGDFQGEAFRYFEDGKLNWKKNYKDGKLDGEYLVYFKSGQLKESGYYKEGKKEGLWEELNEEKIIINEAEYKNGKPVGENNKTRYESGALKTHKLYSKRGELQKEQAFYENGQLEYEKNYKDAVVQGPATFYNKDGSVHGIQQYDGKDKIGVTKWKDSQGKVVKITSFKAGKPDGEWMETHANGTTRMEGVYKDGNFDGKWNFYREEGTLMKWEEWEDNILQRERYYDRNGNSVRAQEWQVNPKLTTSKNLETLLNNSLEIPEKFATNDRMVVKIVTNLGKVDTVEIVETANDKVDSILIEFLAKTEWTGGKYDLKPSAMANEYIIDITKEGQFDVVQGRFYPQEEEKPESAYRIVEFMPSFPGGEKELFTYLGKGIRYPADAREANINGTVYIRFTIQPSGLVSNPKILRGAYPSLDEEVIRIVKEMPVWNPGEQRGRKVRVLYTLPVRFVLD